MVVNIDLGAESSAEPARPQSGGDLAEELVALAASAARDADEPVARERVESLFLPGVPLS